MKNTYRILSVYTGDVSGVCSALYELGGMVVIHDPSGCNSTYNTHDETRWYHQESLIFISGVKERDVIFGNDKKFIDDIIRTAEKLKPAFIALCTSPLPFLNGTDFKGIAHLLEKRLGIPAFFIPTTGMHDYSYGAGNAFSVLVDYLPEKEKTVEHSLNLLGVTPLEFDAEGSLEELYAFAEEAGFSVNSCWAMGKDSSRWKEAVNAAVNLVVSVTGLSAAKKMEERYGIPYVVGCPIGAFRENLKQELYEAEKTGNSRIAYYDINSNIVSFAAEKAEVYLPGEPVTMGSLAAAIHLATDKKVRVVCPLEIGREILAQGDICTVGEEDMEAALSQAKVVIADPLYKYILNDEVDYQELSHEAFSGRCFRKNRKNLMRLNINELL